MFGPQEYTLINIKVVSALVLERIFFQEKLSISVAKQAYVWTVP